MAHVSGEGTVRMDDEIERSGERLSPVLKMTIWRFFAGFGSDNAEPGPSRPVKQPPGGDPYADTPQEAVQRRPITARPKVTHILKDELVKAVAKASNLENCIWTNVGMTELVVEDVSFKYSTFTDCYFHKVKFRNCDFTGCKFIRCNLPITSFIGCEIQYAYFELTNVEREAVLTNEPKRPNVARDLYRNLRVNALQLGNLEDANVYVDRELNANREFYRKAIGGNDSFLSQKYPNLSDKIRLRGKLFANRMSQIIWGNGESFVRLVVATFALTFLLALADFILNAFGGAVATPLIQALFDHVRTVVFVLLDVDAAGARSLMVGTKVLLVITRYAFLGLVFTIVFRRSAYR